MSDPKSTYGEPVEEPRPADDDVVGRAHDSLADAEAAKRDAAAAGDGETAASDSSAEPRQPAEVAVEPAAVNAPEPAHDSAVTDASASTPVDTDWFDRADAAERARIDAEDAARQGAAHAASADDPTPADPTPADPSRADPTPADVAAETAVVREPVAVTPSEPVPPVATTPAAAGAAPAAAQPIFVQAPEPPRPRGNRGAAGAIGLLAAVAFGVLYLAAWVALGFLGGTITASNIAQQVLGALTTAALWVPIVVFYIGFWLLGAVINRGRWGSWVIFGLFVGLVAYLGHILGQLFQAPFWTLTASEGSDLVRGQLLAPLAIAAFVIGRELTIWFGSWVAARGRRVTELNDEAQREYERTLEAGPQLSRV